MPLQVLCPYPAHARCAIQAERDHRVISEGERLQRMSIGLHAGSEQLWIGLLVPVRSHMVLRRCSDLLRNRRRNEVVVIHLHTEAATALRHGGEC
jgi:hypothetical protein